MNIWNTFSIYYHSLTEALYIALISCFGLDICPLGRNQLIVWFVSVWPSKMGQTGGRKQKSLSFFLIKKHTYCQPVTWHILLNRCSSNYQYIIKIKVKKFVFIPLVLCVIICVTYICYVCFIHVQLDFSWLCFHILVFLF